MIKILLLDDSNEKITIVKNFLIEECNISENDIDVRMTIKDGRKILYSDNYDLLLLDLVMPRDSESEATADESVKFLDEIYFNSEIHIPVHIIGFTQHDDLIISHLEKFEDKLWHLINFSYTNNSWKYKLKNKISHLISVKKRFQESIELKLTYDIGIICALDNPEFKEILALPCEWQKIQFEDDPLIYYHGKVNTINGNQFKIIACSINKMGMQATASVSSMMIAKFKIKFLFMTGICAGIKGKNLQFGDIVISENSTDYGSGKMSEDKNGNFHFKPEPHQYQTDQALISMVNDFIRDKSEILKIQSSYNGNPPKTILQAFVGPIASGSYVVANKALIESIAEPNRKLLAVDMESHGLYLACHYFNQTKALFIKSVCDFGDNLKDDDYQVYSSYTSAQFLYSFIFNVF